MSHFSNTRAQVTNFKHDAAFLGLSAESLGALLFTDFSVETILPSHLHCPGPNLLKASLLVKIKK